jgi:glutamine---fructose-6-phosphate transaminase (isomerizing)
MAMARGRYLEAEILEQPEVFERILAEEGPRIEELVRAIKSRKLRAVVIAARGSSDHAATYAKYLIESVVGVPVALAAPSLYTLYKSPPDLSRCLVMAISQSGESEDVQVVLRTAREQGAMTCAITNVDPSPLGDTAEFRLDQHAGAERAVAATKTYTAELLLVAWLAAAWAGDEGLLTELQAMPGYMREALETRPRVSRLAERYSYIREGVVLGRGYHLATALEIALKLKETCYVSVQGYSWADFLHGPAAMVDRGLPIMLVAPPGPTIATMVEMAERLSHLGAHVIALTSDEALGTSVAWHINLPAGVPERLAPMPYVVPGQLLALNLARLRGIDPDVPRNITKVTHTR